MTRIGSRLSRFVGVGVAIGALALTVVACSSGGGTSTGSAATTSMPATSGTRVTATLTDFHIALSQQAFSPGTYTFVATNAGQTTHALEISGPGVSDQRTSGDIQPGQSANLTVTLQAGSYEIFCPVDGHKGLGMDLTINVGGGGSNTVTSNAMTSAGGNNY